MRQWSIDWHWNGALQLLQLAGSDMIDPLAVYLHDHLAGATFAVHLLEDLSEHSADADVSRFSAHLLAEVETDRAALQELVERIGEETSVVKEAAAWVAQKMGRFKLTVGEPLGTFEAIEALSLGVQGKLAMWNALRAVRLRDNRLDRLDLDELASRAIKQFELLEDVRLRLAQSVLAKPRRQSLKN